MKVLRAQHKRGGFTPTPERRINHQRRSAPDLRLVWGFSMVELLVSIGLFSVLVSIAVGGFTNALRTQRQTVALLSASSNIGLVLEQMAREMRTGYDFCTNGQVCGGTSELAFKNANRVIVTYCFAGDTLYRGGSGACGGAGFAALTADNIAVRYLTFSLQGNLPSDGAPPRITMAIGISPKEAALAGNVLRIETTVSARAIDT